MRRDPPGDSVGSRPLAEQQRNDLLRRVDWRFLLPNPNPARSICYCTGPLHQAVALISASMQDLNATTPALADCDLAVAVNPDGKIVLSAMNALRPGGSLYAEWTSPDADDLTRLRRGLEAHGFADIAFYHPFPDPTWGPVACWIPVEHLGALRYALGLHRSRPSIRRAIEIMARR